MNTNADEFDRTINADTNATGQDAEAVEAWVSRHWPAVPGAFQPGLAGRVPIGAEPIAQAPTDCPTAHRAPHTGDADSRTGAITVHVTLFDFVSIETHNSGMRSRSTFIVSGHNLSYWYGRVNQPVRKRTGKLTDRELKALVDVLEANHFPALAGSYSQHRLYDATSTDTTLTLKVKGAKQTFTVHNYGQQAPPAYYKISDYLSQLMDAKFPDE